MASVAAALIAASVLGMWFTTTRWISVGASATLCFLFPWLAPFVVIAAAWAFLFFRVRKP